MGLSLSLCFSVLEPVCEEYKEMNERYELERECRGEAERYASKVSLTAEYPQYSVTYNAAVAMLAMFIVILNFMGISGIV